MLNSKILRFIILVGIFIVPFVPFVVSSSLFFPFITGKAFVFRTIVILISACYFILAIRDSAYRPKFSWILGAVSAFLFSMLLATIFAENPFKAFWSNFERMEGFVTLLHLFAYFLVVGSILKTQEIWNKLLATSLLASFIMSLYSLFQIAGKIAINQGGVRVDGTLGNASYLAIYLVFHIFFAALLFLRSKLFWQKAVLSLVTILNLVVLFYTATRGAILGLLGGALVSFIFLVLKSEKGQLIRKVAALAIAIIIIFTGLFASLRNNTYVRNHPVLGRFASLSFSEIKSQGRYYVWPMAIKGFVERPILGWGQEGFNFVFNKYYNPKMYNQEPWFDRAHNTFLDWLVAGGILGFVAYLSIILSVIFYVFKAGDEFLNKSDKAVILGLLSAYVFNNLFVFDQISSYILFFTLLSYVHTHTTVTKTPSFWERVSQKLRKVFERENFHPIFESIIVILTLVVFYLVVIDPLRTNHDLLEVLKINNQGQVGTIEKYIRPLQKNNIGFAESLEHVSQVAMSLASNQNASEQLKQQLFNEVDQAFKKQLERAPNDARYRLFYGIFLSRFGWYGRAVEELKKASLLSPNKQSIYFELINNLLLDNKKAEALEKARLAYELEPNYSEAKIIYAIVADFAGDQLTAKRLFSEIDSSKLVFDDKYLNILISFGEVEKVIEVINQRIKLEPSNLNHRMTLAAVYLNLGRRNESVKVLEEIIKINPSFKEQVEYYINEIKAGRNP